MCGIAGWFGHSAVWDATRLRDGLIHRGPDGSGVWHGGMVTLVHTRLAILELTGAGHQPMVLVGAALVSRVACGSDAVAVVEKKGGV
jgi:asparagine synthetase B (glutamine-hydrolysing)